MLKEYDKEGEMRQIVSDLHTPLIIRAGCYDEDSVTRATGSASKVGLWTKVCQADGVCVCVCL